MQQLLNKATVKPRLIVVLGMHRSGTSAITKALELLGVGLGSSLHPAGVDNPKGFWEDEECIQINEELLRHLGSAYDRLDFAWDEIKVDDVIAELKLKATKLITNRLLESDGIWGFKDPRTCRLLAFWSNVFNEVGCDVGYVLQTRNPASVVVSLETRNSIHPEKSYYLWLQHVLPSLLSTKNCPRVVIDYDEFLANPYLQLDRISSKLGLPLPARESQQIRDYENSFLDSKLRHANYTEDDLARDIRASKLISETHSLLLRLAEDDESIENPIIIEKINQLNQRLKELSPAFSYINILEGILMKRDAHIMTEDRIIVEQSKQLEEKNTIINQQAKQITDRTLEIEAQSKQIMEKTQALEAQAKQINEKRLEIEAQTQQIAEIYASRSWRLTKPFRFFKRSIQNLRLLFMR